MSMTPEFQQALERATALYAQGDLASAEKAYQALAKDKGQRERVLRALLDLYLHWQRPLEAIDTLKSLIEEAPGTFIYYNRLAALYEGLGQLGSAIYYYQQFLQGQPDHANACFNIALLYRKGKQFAEAVNAYERAISLGIDELEEVYSNMGVLFAEMRQVDKARAMYERALEVDDDYIPALFNLAGLYEELGNLQAARERYERILILNPQHWESLSRLAYADRVDSNDSPLMASLRQASEAAGEDLLGRESIFFALGKAYDDLQRFEDAFAAYSKANKLGRLRNSPYVQRQVEQGFDELIEVFSQARMQAPGDGPRAAPVFICGMFRSGSSLVEQILAGHPAITAGGELDYLQWLVRQRLSPFPARFTRATREELLEFRFQYLKLLRSVFPDAQCVTDKQPDNFLFLGLVKMLFPAAKIIYTSRNAVDNCLSINFQQLGGKLSYATDLADTAHYYRQHKRLMEHWLTCFPDNIFTVNYDELVSSPEPVVRQLLAFLGLDWDEGCLAFQQSDNPVRTASVWQVRGELHTNSSGRWQNYAPFVEGIRDLLD